MDEGALKSFLYGFSDLARALFASPWGLALVGAVVVVVLLARVWNAARDRALACAAAGKRLGAGEAALVAVKELGSAIVGAGAAIPAILAAVAAGAALVAVADSLRSLEEMKANAERVRELSAVVRHLEGRYKVMDVRVDSVSGGTTTLSLSYYASDGRDGPAASETLSIAGTDIYLDAVVCNFAYTEIAGGREVNLAVPYRIFSDRVPESQGLPLAVSGPDGVPYMYERAENDIYGLAPGVYRERLAELVSVMGDDAASRREGLVRSVYGNAVHRRVASGDRFSVWVEASGGLSIKDSLRF
ncbi:MAG: hypothetical protein KBB32_09485 [Spirochaetia bacterium]|nr:hypothetical protein [Spirochaetia bacterium]